MWTTITSTNCKYFSKKINLKRENRLQKWIIRFRRLFIRKLSLNQAICLCELINKLWKKILIKRLKEVTN